MARGGRGAPQGAAAKQGVRWFGAAILASCVAVIALGVGMGFYLDRPPEGAPATQLDRATTPSTPPPPASPPVINEVAATASSLPATESPAPSAPDPPAAPLMPSAALSPTAAPDEAASTATALPAPPPDSTASKLAEIEPQAGTPAKDPVLVPAAAATSVVVPLPLRLDSGRTYWVEYAVFAGVRSANRLHHALAALHLETKVVATHGANGRRLWRVRSLTLSSRDATERAATAARQALRIEPLIHRGTPDRVPELRYWVEFGAYPTIVPAVRLQRILADNGVKATVHRTRTMNGKPSFVIRSEDFSNRKLATFVGELGANAAKVVFRVGATAKIARHRAHRALTDGTTGSSRPPHTHRPPPGG